MQKGGSDAISQFKKTKQGSGLLNGSLGEPHEKRKVLSQSLSFPSKGSRKTFTSTRQTKVASSNTNGLIFSYSFNLGINYVFLRLSCKFAGHLTAKITASSVQKTSVSTNIAGFIVYSNKILFTFAKLL